MIRVCLVVLFCFAVVPHFCSAAEYVRQFPRSEGLHVSDIAADSAGNVLVVGFTTNRFLEGAMRLGATNSSPARYDSYLMKLTPNGQQLAAVVFGGTNDDLARKIAVASDGSIVVAGETHSPDFPGQKRLEPLLHGGGDVFICKFDVSGTNMVFSTYLGGRSSESVSGLSVDGYGDIIVGGSSASSEYWWDGNGNPFLNGYRPFVAKISGDGRDWIYGFRFGGTGWEGITGVASDEDGNAYLTGYTTSVDFPVDGAFQHTKPLNTVGGFVMKLLPDGEVDFSTFLAGDCDDMPLAVAVDPAGDIVVAGNTCSEEFPKNQILPPSPAGRTKRAFVVKVDGDGSGIFEQHFINYTSTDEFRSLGILPGGNVIAAGTVHDSRGIPVFATLIGEETISTAFDRTDCEPLAFVEAMAIGPAGEVFVSGIESRESNRFVARYQAGELDGLAEPRVRLVTPISDWRYTPRHSLRLEAAVVGGLQEVDWVKFYAGQKLIGTATNVPYQVSWTNAPRGVYNIRAVARVNGQTIASCVTRVTIASPPNDNFAKRQVLSGAGIDVPGDTTAATLEPSEPWRYEAQTVWYSWRAPQMGNFKFLVTSVSSEHSLNLFTGSRLEQLLMAPGDSIGGSGVTLRAQRGTTYQVRVGGREGRDGRFRLEIEQVVPPANDDFASAIPLIGESPSLVVSTRDSAPDTSATAWGTIWYSWTAPSSGLYVASVEGAGVLPGVQVYTGTAFSNLVSTGRSVYGTLNGRAWYATNGTVYFISLSGGDPHAFTLAITPHLPPVNDSFANRIVIPTNSLCVTGSLVGATVELGEPGISYSPEPSVWWTWRPTSDGIYNVRLVPRFREVTGISPRSAPISPSPVRIFVGNTLEELAEVQDRFSSLVFSALFNASSATNYQISISGGVSSFAVEIERVGAPSNDDFAYPRPLSGPIDVEGGSTWGASLEPGESRHYSAGAFFGATDSVWYRWVAPSNAFFSVAVNGAAVLDIYRGTNLVDAILVASNANNHVIRTIAGTEYRFAVAQGPQFTLLIRPALPPPNDDFENSVTITGLNVLFSGDNRDATGQAAEPPHGGNTARQSIWFSWVAPTNGAFSLNLVEASSGNSRVGVYVGESLGELVSITTGFPSWQADFVATAGTSYHIAVERIFNPFSALAASNPVEMELRYLPPPPNDDFANRIRLTGKSVSIAASNVAATFESGEPLNFPFASSNTVWWSWRAPRDGRAQFAIEGSFGGSLAVYSGLSLGDLVVLSEPNSVQQIVNLPVQEGVEYQISVDGYVFDPTGQFELMIHHFSAPSNDDFARRRAFTGRANGTLQGASREPGEPGYEGDPNGGSVWWKWTAPRYGLYDVTINPSGSGLSVFTGEELETLEQVFPSTSNTNQPFTFEANAGDTYVFQLFSSDPGTNYTMRIARRLFDELEGASGSTLESDPALPGGGLVKLNRSVSGRGFTFSIEGSVGSERRPWTVETSTDLIRWTTLTNLPSLQTEFSVMPDSRDTQRFYRVR